MVARRKLFVVRHAEREDNVNKQWRKMYPEMTRDNPPLSLRGQSQALDLRNCFENIRIDSAYVSPFDRTMETATILLAPHSSLINVEPGFSEVLHMCCKPPGFWGIEQLCYKFPRTNMQYRPVFVPPLPAERHGDEGCCDRVRETIFSILASDVNSENILIVSHGGTIAGVHHALGSDFQYVGQATVSVFEETAPHSRTFTCLTSGNTRHLSEENSHSLRAY